MLLGNFYKKMKRPQDAIAAYRDALARDNEHQNALFSLALAYKDEGRLDEARVGFERARELDPEEWKGALAARRPLDAARATPRAPRPSSPTRSSEKSTSHRFLLKLGEIRIEAKRFDEAERALKAALEKKPGLALAHFDLGLVYEGQGTDRQGDRTLPDGARGQPQGLPRGVQRREAAAEDRPRQRRDRAFPQGRRDRADIRNRPPVSRPGAARGRRSRPAPSSGRAAACRTTRSRGWRRSATTCSRTSTNNAGAWLRRSASSPPPSG